MGYTGCLWPVRRGWQFYVIILQKGRQHKKGFLMKNKIKIGAVVLIGLLMAAGLVLIGCGEGCPGSGECTVTIEQNAYGFYVDDDSPLSSCGKTKSGDSSSSGCQVANMSSPWYSETRRYGTHGCDCEKVGLLGL